MFQANYLSVSTNENMVNHVQTPVCIRQTQLCSVFPGAWLRAHSYEKGAVHVLSRAEVGDARADMCLLKQVGIRHNLTNSPFL